MKKYIREVSRNLSITVLVCVFPALVPAQPAQNKTYDKIIDEKISQMTLEEKVGQLFIVGFPQSKIDNKLSQFISKYKPGSFLIFKRNIQSLSQIRTLNSDIYQAAYKATTLPPLIAIDQEGGAVSRLPIDPAQPNAFSIGQTQSPLIAEEMGYQTGLFLREVGFNMNLAPVLDVADPFSTSFIGVRSFGPNPVLVKDLGIAYSKGLLRSRVIPTAKHFPGTGNLKADPHSMIVTNSSPISSLKKIDLVPFEGFASLGENVAVMLSHSIYPALDPSQEPASFSSKISTELLRADLKYSGLVLTDDLQMKGSRELLLPEKAAIKALKAGADIVMLTWSFTEQEKAIRAAREAVRSGEISTEELNTKLRRILTVKGFANVYKKDPSLPSVLIGDNLSSPNYASLEDQILNSNITTNLTPKTLPQKVSKERAPASINKVCALAPSNDFIEGFSSATNFKVASHRIANTSSSSELTKWAESSQCSVLILAVTGLKTARLLRSLSSEIKAKTVVVNLGAPGLLKIETPYKKVLQLYFNHKDSGRKVAEHLHEILGIENPNVATR